MKRVAFVTYKEKPDLFLAEERTREVLEHRGHPVSAVPWNQPDADWTQYDIVVLRSTWDYHNYADAFLAWLTKLESEGVNLWNRPATVRWNMRKSYLEELGRQGVRIPHSHFVPRKSDVSLADLIDPEWPGAVLKPVISASAEDTFYVTVENAADHQADLDRVLQEKDAIVQEFMPEVQREGEWSLIFMTNQFSHAVLKRPGDGDFRVQIQYGGGQEAENAPESLIVQAGEIVTHVPEPLLYARIDGVNRQGTFILMELELIEPYLFLEYDEGAAERFADAILDMC